MRIAERREEKSVDAEKQREDEKRAGLRAMHLENLRMQKHRQEVSKSLNRQSEDESLRTACAQQDEAQK